MQDLSQDMDELFRKAVELSPLKICESRWEDLSTKISSKKRPFLFIPIGLRKIYLRMPVLFSILILVPAIIVSVAVLFKNKVTKRSFQTLNSKTISSSALNQTNRRFTPSDNFVSYPVSQDNKIICRYQKKNKSEDSINTLSNELFDESRPLPKASHEHISPNQFDNQPKLENSFGAVQLMPLRHLIPGRRLFYFGLLGGSIFSQVKDQPLTKPGFDAGFLFGYTINKRLSVEIGIMRTKQYFIASGDYLHRTLNINAVKSLEASRDAFSIPLKLKYNLVNGFSGSFFLTAGVSSFAGVNDHIVIRVSNLPIPATDKIDLGATDYLPSYLTFSLGYDYKIGKFSSIRIEPYLEIPMHGNAGNSFKTHSSDPYMEVFNSGIHIAVTHLVF